MKIDRRNFFGILAAPMYRRVGPRPVPVADVYITGRGQECRGQIDAAMEDRIHSSIYEALTIGDEELLRMYGVS